MDGVGLELGSASWQEGIQIEKFGAHMHAFWVISPGLNLAWVGPVILHPARCNNIYKSLGKYLFTEVNININHCLRSRYLTQFFFLQPTYFPHPKLSSSISHPQSPLPSPPQPP